MDNKKKRSKEARAYERMIKHASPEHLAEELRGVMKGGGMAGNDFSNSQVEFQSVGGTRVRSRKKNSSEMKSSKSNEETKAEKKKRKAERYADKNPKKNSEKKKMTSIFDHPDDLVEKGPENPKVWNFLRRFCALCILMIIISRKGLCTVFGAGTGVNKVHVSPLSVAALAATENKFVNSKQYSQYKPIVRDVFRALALPGEILAASSDAYARDEMSSRRRNKKKKKSKKNGREKKPMRNDIVSNAARWVENLKRTEGLVKFINENWFLQGSAATIILGAFIGPLLEVGDTITCCGVVGWYFSAQTIANRHQMKAQPNMTNLFYGVAVILVMGYYAGSKLEIIYKAQKKEERRAKVEAQILEEKKSKKIK